MPQHRHLSVTGTPQAIERVVEQITRMAVGPWSRARDQERKILGHGRGPNPYVCLAFAGVDGIMPALVVLHAAAEELSLGNLFLRDDDRYEDAELIPLSNAVVVRVHDDLIAPAALAEGAHVDFGPDEPKLSDWMTAQTAQLLHAFSGAANKDTGGSHPNDRRRFLDFLIAAHAENASLRPEELEAWLRDDGWSAKYADRLGSQYEFGRALLARAST